MVRMEQLAPMGVFEDEDVFVPAPNETPYERRFDDYSRNYEDAA